jgi:hypothetical protein
MSYLSWRILIWRDHWCSTASERFWKRKFPSDIEKEALLHQTGFSDETTRKGNIIFEFGNNIVYPADFLYTVL